MCLASRYSASPVGPSSRPFPERFVYQENPAAAAWHALERSADDAGFEMYTRERPSIAYRKWRAARREPNALLGDDAVALYQPPSPGTRKVRRRGGR